MHERQVSVVVLLGHVESAAVVAGAAESSIFINKYLHQPTNQTNTIYITIYITITTKN